MSKTVEWLKISNLDLKLAKEKLKEKKSWWWNLWNDVDKLELEYKQFLYLILANPGKTVVPWSQNMDDLWHEHILDTKKYKKDCEEIFGKFVDHNPHLPIGTPEQTKAFSETKEMYREAFGEKVKNKSSGKPSSEAACGAGCTAIMPVVFCGASHDGGHSGHDGHSCGSHDSGHSCGGHSCGGHGCSSCSSCSSCGGGD
jgi:hypothetical protein